MIEVRSTAPECGTDRRERTYASVPDSEALGPAAGANREQ